jgi:hypothetical protein
MSANDAVDGARPRNADKVDNSGGSQMKLANLEWRCAMDSDVVETDDDILTFEVPDDSLERAAVPTEAQVTTIGICTH